MFFHRSATGASIFLVLAEVLVLVCLGVGLLFVCNTFFSSRKTSNLADTAALTLAKYVVTSPQIHLADGLETDTFLADSDNGLVTLFNYNRLVRHALLISASAAADGNQASIDKANAVIDSLCGPKDSIAARLSNEVEWAVRDYSNCRELNSSDSGDSKSIPASIAAGSTDFPRVKDGRPSIGRSYLGGKPNSALKNYLSRPLSKFAGFINEGGPSNIDYTDIQLPFISAKNTPNIGGSLKLDFDLVEIEMPSDHKKHKFVPGYKPLRFKGGAADKLKTIIAMPLSPCEQPHLVSEKDFSKAPVGMNSSQLFATKDGLTCVPPNAFCFVGSGQDSSSAQILLNFAFCAATSMYQSFATDSGYIEIVNGGFDSGGKPLAGYPANGNGDKAVQPDGGNTSTTGTPTFGGTGSGGGEMLIVTPGEHETGSGLFTAVEKFKDRLRKGYPKTGNYKTPIDPTGVRIYNDTWVDKISPYVANSSGGKMNYYYKPNSGSGGSASNPDATYSSWGAPSLSFSPYATYSPLLKYSAPPKNLEREGTGTVTFDTSGGASGADVVEGLLRHIKAFAAEKKDPSIVSRTGTVGELVMTAGCKDQIKYFLVNRFRMMGLSQRDVDTVLKTKLAMGESMMCWTDNSGAGSGSAATGDAASSAANKLIITKYLMGQNPQGGQPKVMLGDITNFQDKRRLPVGSQSEFVFSFCSLKDLANCDGDNNVSGPLFNTAPDPTNFAVGKTHVSVGIGNASNNNLAQIRIWEEVTPRDASGNFANPN